METFHGSSHDPTTHLYNNSLILLDELQQSIRDEIRELHEFNIEDIKSVPGNLDVYDYLFAVAFGVIGSVISSSDFVKGKMNKIHIDSSKESPNTLLGKLLQHKGQPIDQIGGKFIKRDGSPADLMFHRLLWGHDPLSFGRDNPFLLMQGNGKIKAIFSVFKHLFADTFSNQGLPIPTHSYLDYTKEGKLSNHLLETAKNYANSDRVKSQEIFSRMFTIRAQDIASQGFVWAACTAYIYARKIDDHTRKRQIKLISYCVNFFSHAAIGAIRQAGVPYIHWPALMAIIKELAGLYIDSYKDIKRLEKITDSFIAKNNEIEKRVFATGKSLITHENPNNYIIELKEQDIKCQSLINFFEEA